MSVPSDLEPPIKDCITVVETVYHRPMFGGEPFVSDTRFNRELDTYEQVYERKHIEATERWQRLNLGWIQSCGMLVILNEEGRFLQKNPTDEERERMRSKILEVSYDPPDPTRSWLIPAGETIRVVPSTPNSISIRCRNGKAYYTVRAFPA